MADYSKLTKTELIMTLYARDLMLENERKPLKYLTEKYFEFKQQLHDLPKKIVEEIKDGIIKYDLLKNFPNEAGYCMFDSILDTILEKYGGKDEINND